MKIELTRTLAKAIVLADNVAWSEGQGLSSKEWVKLFLDIEREFGLTSDYLRYSYRKENIEEGQ